MRNYKNLIFTIITFTLISCGQKRNKIGHLEEYNLKGDVWKVIEHPYKGKGNMESFEILDLDKFNWEFPHKLFEFDKYGYLIKDCKIKHDGDIDKCINQKIENLKILRISNKDTFEIKINNDGIKAEIFDSINQNYIYEQSGNLDIYRYNYDNHTFFYEFKLNSNGRVIEGHRIDEFGKRHLGIKHSYNSEGDLILLKEYSSETDSLLRKRQYMYKYDNEKNWTQKIVFENNEFIVAIKRDIYYFKDCFKKLKKEDIIGLWKKNNSERWIEFFENGKIDIGKAYSIRESGTWELDESSKRVTLRLEKGGIKYDYKFSGCNLILANPANKLEFDTYRKVVNK